MPFPRVGHSAPNTPHGGRDRFTSFTPAHHRSQGPTPSSTGGSEYYSLSPSSTTSSVSRVDAAVSRINSMSDIENDPQLTLKASTNNAPSLGSSTASRTPTTNKLLKNPPAAADIFQDKPAPRTPLRPTHRVTRSVGSFPFEPPAPLATEGVFSPRSPANGIVRKPTLPSNPAHWTPSELAQHLAYTLRTGGPDGDDPTLPPPVIEDVISWVLRSRITGAQFLRGIDAAHRGGRPPPFFPVLSALSRRMRRKIRHRRNSSAFSEADVFEDSDDSDGVTRVKRLAHAFDAVSSCSEASDAGNTSLSALRAQITGDSITGYGRVTPKTEARTWARARRDSAASAMSGISAADSAMSGISAASAPLWRIRTTDSEASTSSAAAAANAVASWAQQCSIPLNPPDSPTVARKAAHRLSIASSIDDLEEEEDGEDLVSKAKEATEARETTRDGSPPPPYVPEDASPNPSLLFPPVATPAAPAAANLAVPASPEPDSRSASLTPLQGTPDTEAHLLRMVAHKSAGIDPYRVLRRGSGRPSLAAVDDADDDDSPWSGVATRRASRRAAATDALNPRKTSTPKRDRDVSREVAELTKRIRELENRLVAVESPPPETEDQADDEADEETDAAEHDGNGDGSEDPADDHICPTCSRGPSRTPSGAYGVGFPTPNKLNSSSSTRLSSSTSSRVSSRLTASTRSTLSMSAADQTLELIRQPQPDTDEDKEEAADDEDKQMVPYHQSHVSWLALLGLVDEYGTEHRYRDLPIYLFLMGVGVGVGFSAVVLKVVLSRRPPV